MINKNSSNTDTGCSIQGASAKKAKGNHYVFFEIHINKNVKHVKIIKYQTNNSSLCSKMINILLQSFEKCHQ